VVLNHELNFFDRNINTNNANSYERDNMTAVMV